MEMRATVAQKAVLKKITVSLLHIQHAFQAVCKSDLGTTFVNRMKWEFFGFQELFIYSADSMPKDIQPDQIS